MNKADLIDRIRSCGILPVIRAGSADEARSLVEAVFAGGVDVMEITMTVPEAPRLIAELSSEYEGRMLIGAGTVLDRRSARECIEAGAKFVVSPALNFDTIAYCNELEIVVIPGALTPTEVVNAWDAGADIVKVFPAGALGGPRYLRSLKAPLPSIKLIPTGGVSLETAGEFIKAGAEAVGVGADLADTDAIRSGNSGRITALAQKYRAAIAKARGQFAG